LIEAFKGLGKSDMKLVIAGDALHEQEYKSELMQRAGNNSSIIFTGLVTGKLLQELFSNCYLFALPSEVEGLPTALLEAMSYGNCCLVSDIPANIEALNGQGYSFQSRNADDLRNKLRKLIIDRAAAERVKDKARDHVLGNYSWDHIASQFEDLYLSLLKQSGKCTEVSVHVD
jgi:glycosyltransferase involved in cell wall biosynthesis